MKTVLITGAGRGLGKELAYKFADDYSLILHSNASELLKMRKLIPDGEENGFRKFKAGEEIKYDTVKGDLRKKTIRYILEELARKSNIDILINNAGVYLNKRFEITNEFEYIEMVEVNLLAPIFLTQAVFPIFKKKQSGLIVNINSTAGKVGSKGESAYCASKFGLRGFSESIKQEASENGISIIDVYLGAMKTDMTKHRKDWDKLIDPKEAAKTIFQICEGHKTLGVREITIGRKNY